MERQVEIEGVSGPHAGMYLVLAGEPVASASAAMLMVHGRGADAESILSLAEDLRVPGFTYAAPQARGNAWYPYPFLAPIGKNEPWLSSALHFLEKSIEWLGEQGLGPEKVVLLGFSQGGCLALEFAAHNARRYGGLVGLSGGLIGPDGTPRDYPGSLAGTPVFLGCSETDFHIPKERVLESGRVLSALGGQVDLRLYSGMGHTINMDEVEAVRALMEGLASG